MSVLEQIKNDEIKEQSSRLKEWSIDQRLAAMAPNQEEQQMYNDEIDKAVNIPMWKEMEPIITDTQRALAELLSSIESSLGSRSVA